MGRVEPEVGLVDRLQAEVLTANTEINRIAKQFTDDGYIPDKYKEDALHLASALFYNIDYIVSWNFKHIVRPRTKDAVRIIAVKEGIKEVKILTPEEVIAMKAKYEEPRVMRELHEIRAKHYEETKHMTDEEYINHINQEGIKVLKKYNMKLKVIDKH